MIFVVNNCCDCYFNLALEEHFLKNREDDVFMLWQNDNTIVVGKNQNTLAETDSEYVKNNGIRVVRRITGGGAVYHDMGNLNYTCITKYDNEWQSDFARFAVPVIDALYNMGLKAEVSGRNDIVSDGRKISGNAQTVVNGRILHHGTLLFDTDLSVLSRALVPDAEKIKDKGIKSVASRVCNISELLGRKITAKELISGIRLEVKKNPGVTDYEITKQDIKEAQKLADNKYRTWEWNYGYSPKYTFSKRKRFKKGTVEACLSVKDGKINDAKFYGDFFGNADTKELENALSGVRHTAEEIKFALSGFDLGEYFDGVTISELIEILI